MGFVLSDQSCGYSMDQRYINLTDQEIDTLVRSGVWPAGLVQNAQLAPSYRALGVPMLALGVIFIALGVFFYNLYQQVAPKKHARSQIPTEMVIKYITGLVRASTADGQIVDIEMQRIRECVARDLGRNVNPVMLRKLAQDLRHDPFDPLMVFDGLPPNIAEDLFFGIRTVVQADNTVTDQEHAFLNQLEQIFNAKYGEFVRQS